ncbi:hypothetical protein [Trueperella pyogenes]
MRIRSIKPEFWTSDDIAELSIEDRLLFIGLWSYVDDNGVGEDREPLIVAALFPLDHYNNPRETLARLSRGLQTLFDKGLITRYISDERQLLQVNAWKKHQRIDRPNKPRFPRYEAIRDTLASVSRDYRETPSTGTGEQGNRGTGEQGNRYIANANALALHKSPNGDVQIAPKTYTQDFETFWAAYPAKKGKRRAYEAWKKALKRATPETIITGAKAYAAWCTHNPTVSTKYPEGWLSASRWEDDLTTGNTGPRDAIDLLNLAGQNLGAYRA